MDKLPASQGASQHPDAVAAHPDVLPAVTLSVNAAALRAFPKNDLRAVMTVNNEKLENLTGIGWALHYPTKQNLTLLQETIQKTCNGVDAEIREGLSHWQESEDSAYIRIPNILQTYQRTQEQAETMLTGLHRLEKSLQWQYSKYLPDTPEQQALSRLHETITQFSGKIHTHREALTALEQKNRGEEKS